MTSVMVSKCELADMYLVVCFADGLVLPGEEDALVEELAADVALHAAGVEDLLARLDAVEASLTEITLDQPTQRQNPAMAREIETLRN